MKFSKMLAAITQVLNQDSDTQVDVCMTSEMARRIELWTAMYEDNAPWVDRKKVKSAQLPAAIASEVARLVTLEMKSEITGGSSATYLNDQYQKKVLTKSREHSRDFFVYVCSLCYSVISWACQRYQPITATS